MGVYITEIFFGLWMHQRVAVDFRCGRQQELGFFRHCQSQGFVGAEGADFEDLDPQGLEIDRTRRAGEVENEI